MIDPQQLLDMIATEASDPAPEISVIRLWPRESECCLCEAPLLDCRHGIPMYEGCVVPEDWRSDWVGRDACLECFQRYERGEIPLWPNHHSTPKNNA